VEITVKYSCHLCGLRGIEVRVPAREVEDVRDWMDATIHLVCADHRRRSPQCHPKELYDLMIPMTGADRIGGPPTH
jgi:hypothetical protein